MLYDSLFDLDDKGNLVPELAETWHPIKFDYIGYIMDEYYYPYNLYVPFYDTVQLLSNYSESDWYEDVLPENLLYDMSDYGINFTIDTDREEEYYIWGFTNCELIIEIILKDNIYFTDYTYLDAEAISHLVEFAHNQPEDTIIHKQWEPVKQVEESYNPDGNGVLLYLSFEGLPYGFWDFMLSLASPMASIVSIDYNYIKAVGTGEYFIVDDTYKGIPLSYFDNELLIMESRGGNWQNKPAPSNDRVIFYYAESDKIADYADICLVECNDEAEYYSIMHDSNYDCNLIANAPYVLQYNLDSELFQNEELRLAFDYCLDIESMYAHNYYNSFDIATRLVDKSNDFWINASRFDLEEAERLFTSNGYAPNDPLEINILCLRDDQAFNVRFYDTWYRYMSTEMPIVVTCYEEDRETYNEIMNSEEAKNYDAYLGEIDLGNINSIYNALKDIDDDDPFDSEDVNMQELLELAKGSGNLTTYFKSYYQVQKHCYENAYISYFGFTTKIFACQNNIEWHYDDDYHPNFDKFSAPEGFNPTGDLYRLDFRHLNRVDDIWDDDWEYFGMGLYLPWLKNY